MLTLVVKRALPLVAILALAVPPAAAARTACPPASADVVRANPVAVVFSRPAAEDPGRVFFACRRRAADTHAVRLTRGEDPGDLYAERFAEHFALAGRVVAWAQSLVPSQSCRHGAPCPAPRGRVIVVRLGAGERRSYPAYPVTQVAVSPAGIVAWVKRLGDGTQAVEAVGRSGAVVTLDTGAIDRRSLRIVEDSIVWRRAGEPQAAPVPR